MSTLGVVISSLVSLLLGYLVNQMPPVTQHLNRPWRWVLFGVVFMATLACSFWIGVQGLTPSRDMEGDTDAAGRSEAPSDTNCYDTSDEGRAIGWGPSRPVYAGASVEDAPRYSSFNVLTDNPNYGDERGFLLVKDASIRTAGGYGKSIHVERGKTYLLRLLVHNGNESGHSAVNTRLSVNLPTCTGHRVIVGGFVNAGDAYPPKIWDEVEFLGNENFNLVPVPESASYNNNRHTGNGISIELGQLLASRGSLIGYDAGLSGGQPGQGCDALGQHVERM